MKHAEKLLKRLLYPPTWVWLTVVPAAFSALFFVFLKQKNESPVAYGIYGLSAYALTALVAAMPGVWKKGRAAFVNSRWVQHLTGSKLGSRYLSDRYFRASVSLLQGMAVNFLYVLFRLVTGIYYHSAWFLSMAAYHLVLGCLRAYLFFGYRRRSPARERRCYRRAAWFLFLLNLPMGGMIVLMVLTDSGFSYPGYVIYLSAMYTFYIWGMAVANVFRFRKMGSPILSAAKILNFVAAMMSVLGLQTAMIAQFSPQDNAFRTIMNAITGGIVYASVIVIAILMLHHGKKQQEKEENACE